ncbi:MAG: carbohydrate binding family 9 domain-containing protein [Gemmatimonadetes bacterium]|nr:carbohydrate binding family 9 domain-containing protein [Gemmatimonadota bacterium]MBI3568585.1 carbohydrate binding family 9 domain-containing protein [Gemmatimonadota bacterium]
MLLPFLAAFQLAAGQPDVYHALKGQTIATAPMLESPIVIDGKLDEPVWRRAALLTGFSEYQPADQRPAPDSTEVLVWYTPTAIYFGIRAFEPHGVVRATLADRDKISADDNVEIHLDTFHEGRRAFVFIVNPFGVQADGTKNESGGYIPGSNIMPGQTDLSADYLWDSKGRLTDYGYEVEIRIPFSSLRYPATHEQRWGIQIDRHVQHSGYEETWTRALKGSASFIAQEGELRGIAGITHGQTIDLNPELTSTITGAPTGATGAGWGYTSHPQLGGNIRWGLGSNFVLNGTIKPDFSQVEADATQIAADARFALFYPEKRPFFVEGSDLFNVPNTMIYTRRIVQPDAAMKLTGKLGDNDVAVLSALDDGSTTPNGQRPLVDVVRLQRDLGGQSTTGVFYSDRVGGGRTNRVGGADLHYVFGKLYYAQFQAVMSGTSDAAGARSGPMWEALVDRTGRTFGFHYNILAIHPDFATDNGFVTRTGVVQPSIANRYTWYGAPGAFLERFNVYFRQGGTWKYDDFYNGQHVLEDFANANTQFTLRGGWNLNVSPTLSSYAFDSAAYANVRTTAADGSARAFVPLGRKNTSVVAVSLATPQFPGFTASVGGTFGQDVDFFETSAVRRTDYNASLDLRPSNQLRVSATYVSSTFTRLGDGVRTATTRIPRLKVEYQIARPLFVRIVSQYTATLREPLVDPSTGRILLVAAGDGTFVPATEQQSNLLRADFLISYRPSPGTVFFAGYGNSLVEADPLAFQQLRRSTDGFFVKLSWVFSQTVGAQ